MLGQRRCSLLASCHRAKRSTRRLPGKTRFSFFSRFWLYLSSWARAASSIGPRFDARASRGATRARSTGTHSCSVRSFTAILSLDTTAVMLTPVMLALVKRLKLPAAPYIVLCALVANVGSLLLPISNLTNILFADAFHLTFAAFAARMIAPQLVALVITYALLRRHFRREISNCFDGESLPEPDGMVPNRIYFLVCVTVLGVVLIGYFVAPFVGIEPYVVAFAGSGVLAIAGAATGRVRIRAVGELSWGVFPFVVGLFVAVQDLRIWASSACRPGGLRT